MNSNQVVLYTFLKDLLFYRGFSLFSHLIREQFKGYHETSPSKCCCLSHALKDLLLDRRKFPVNFHLLGFALTYISNAKNSGNHSSVIVFQNVLLKYGDCN